MTLKQQFLDGRCPDTKCTHPRAHKSFYSNSLLSLFKGRRLTHLLADREPRLLKKQKFKLKEEITEIKKEYGFLLK